MVRYSIEAGLLGPGVCTLSAALCAGAARPRRVDPPQGECFRDQALPIANIPRSSPPPDRRAFATVYAAMRCTIFSRPRPASFCSGWWRWARSPPRAAAWAGAGRPRHRRRFVTPILVSSDKPDFWALYLYLAVVTAAAFRLARIRLWRWLAVTTIVFALLWTFPPAMRASMVGRTFHVTSDASSPVLVVCGFNVGPPADDGQIEPISSGSLAAYLAGATLIVLNSGHANAIVFALLVAGTLSWHGARMLPRARLPASCWSSWCCRMGSPRQSDIGAAGQAAAGIGPPPTAL